MSYIMSNMKKTVSAREFSHQFAKLEKQLRPGESIMITRRGQPLGRFIKELVKPKRPMPDFEERATGFLEEALGFRLELPFQTTVYSSLGRSSRTGDARRSLNQMYGIAKSNIFRTGLRGDIRYSKFDSSFGRGTYRSISLSKEIGEVLRVEIQAGDQDYVSALSAQSRSRYLNSTADWSFGSRYFLGGGYTIYRSRLQKYDQTYINLGCRF